MDSLIMIKNCKLAYYNVHLQRNATQRIPQLYLLNNNCSKFIFQKYFSLCATCGVNLVKSFLTLIKFDFDSLSRKIKNPCLVINKKFFNKGVFYYG